MRTVAIDFGKKRIGIAITDNEKRMVFPLKTIPASHSLKESALKLFNELKEYKIDTIIIGLPLLLNGQRGPMAEIVEKFKEELSFHFSIPILFVDERLSSKGADTLLREAGLNRKERDKISDTSAAILLLQTHLKIC